MNMKKLTLGLTLAGCLATPFAIAYQGPDSLESEEESFPLATMKLHNITTFTNATQAAEQAANGQAVSVEMIADEGSPLYLVEVVTGNGRYEVMINAETGKVISKQGGTYQALLSALNGQDDAGTGIAISLQDVMNKAQAATGGNVLEADLDLSEQPAYFVLLETDKGITYATLSARTGKLLVTEQIPEIPEANREQNTGAAVSLAQAIQTAEQTRGGKAIAAGMDYEQEDHYFVTVISPTGEAEVIVDANSGNIVNEYVLEAATDLVSIDQAIQAASKQQPGQVMGAELITEQQQAFYEVFIESNNEAWGVIVDAKTGNITATEKIDWMEMEVEMIKSSLITDSVTRTHL